LFDKQSRTLIVHVNRNSQDPLTKSPPGLLLLRHCRFRRRILRAGRPHGPLESVLKLE
jgi:hypothetical protein